LAAAVYSRCRKLPGLPPGRRLLPLAIVVGTRRQRVESAGRPGTRPHGYRHAATSAWLGLCKNGVPSLSYETTTARVGSGYCRYCVRCPCCRAIVACAVAAASVSRFAALVGLISFTGVRLLNA